MKGKVSDLVILAQKWLKIAVQKKIKLICWSLPLIVDGSRTRFKKNNN